jgi:hypothetical protein
MVIRRQPPPPPLTADPAFNRWLHDLTSFISDSGGIDPSQFPDLSNLQTQVATNTSAIAALTSNLASLQSSVTTINGEISTINGEIATNNSAIAALQANPILRSGSGAPAGGLGNNSDWYGDTTNKHIYIKSAGTWVLIV